MIGHTYFSTSHFAAQAKCSPRTARRFLRTFCKAQPGEHVRLDGQELQAAVAAFHEEQSHPREMRDIWEIRALWRRFWSIRNDPSAIRAYADEVERRSCINAAPC